MKIIFNSLIINYLIVNYQEVNLFPPLREDEGGWQVKPNCLDNLAIHNSSKNGQNC